MNAVKPKIIHPIKYTKIHNSMFDKIEAYVNELYPEYKVKAVKIILDKK